MPLKTFGDNPTLMGAQLFANEALSNFLSQNKDKTQPKYENLRIMMQGNMYFTDARFPKDPYSKKVVEKSHQFDIVGFKDGQAVAFTFLCDNVFNITHFRQVNDLSNMSKISQKMVEDLSERQNPSGPTPR